MLHNNQHNPNEPEFPIIPERNEDNSHFDYSKEKSDINNNNNNDLIEGEDIVIEEQTIQKPPLENNIVLANSNKHKNLKLHQQIEMTNLQEIKHKQMKRKNTNNEEPPHDSTGEVHYPDLKKITRAQKLVQDKLKVPPRLFKTFIVSLVLAVLGLVLIILGCIESIAEHTPGKGIMFWILGGVVMIPGGFYSYKFYQARKAKDEYERENIFDNIPEL